MVGNVARSEKGGETTNLATLKRGKVYKHFWNGQYIEFRRNVPKPIDDDLADQLEELIDIIGTEDDQTIEIDRFNIERDVPISRLAEDDSEPTTRQRTRLVRETVPIKRKSPALRKPPKVMSKAKPGFGRRTQPAE